jgi:hypothetical protein
MRAPRCERRTVVERVLGVCRPLLDGASEGVDVVPQLEDAAVECRQVDPRLDAPEP